MPHSLKSLQRMLLQPRSFLLSISASVLVYSLSSVAIALPTEIEMDRFMLAAETSLHENRLDKVEKYLARINGLDISPPPLFHYYQAAVYKQQGFFKKQRAALETYVERAGKKAKYYTDALIEITRLEEMQGSRSTLVRPGSLSQTTLVSTTKAKTDEERQYAEQLKKLYLAENYSTALVRHINDMLATHVYTGRKLQASVDSMQGVVYKISLGKDTSILTTTKDRRVSPEKIVSDRLSIFGKNSFIEHACDYDTFRCVIKKPDNHTKWLEISYNADAAIELSKAFSQLIQVLQQGPE